MNNTQKMDFFAPNYGDRLSPNLTSLIAVDRLENVSDLADWDSRRRTAQLALPLLPPLFREELFNR